MVTNLAARSWVESSESAADLLALALARRGRLNAFVCVEIEEWRDDELRDYIEAGSAEYGMGRTEMAAVKMTRGNGIRKSHRSRGSGGPVHAAPG